MSKPTYLTDEQWDRLNQMTHHIHELKMLVDDRRSRRMDAIDPSIEEPLAMMAVRVLTEVERANEELQNIEQAKREILMYEKRYVERSKAAEAFYRAMKAAYPDADLDTFLDIAETL